MSAKHTPPSDYAMGIGKQFARRFFQERSRYSELHLGEAELAGAFAIAIDLSAAPTMAKALLTILDLAEELRGNKYGATIREVALAALEEAGVQP